MTQQGQATDTRRVLILTIDYGLGHRSAAEAVAAAIRETYGEAAHVEVVNPLEDSRAPALLREGQDRYDEVVQELPELYNVSYQISDASAPSTIIESVLTLMLFPVLRDLVRDFEPDVIVTTIFMYQAPLGALFTLSEERVPLVTVITDLVSLHELWFNEAADLCLVPTETARNLALGHGLPEERVRITGIPVDPALAREERDQATLRAELGWHSNLLTILAVGGKRVSHLKETLDILNHSGLPIQLIPVAGGNEALWKQFQETEWHLPAHCYDFVDDMPTLMKASDAIICKAGGLIVTESLAAGLPLMLVDVLPGQETGNAEFVVEKGAGVLVEHPATALETIRHWVADDGALLAERARNARRLGHPRAAYQVAEIAWNAKTGDRPASRRSWLIELFDRNEVPWR
jgi:1,2-diacylglycerol 3-beta-galactosyltransferase